MKIKREHLVLSIAVLAIGVMGFAPLTHARDGGNETNTTETNVTNSSETETEDVTVAGDGTTKEEMLQKISEKSSELQKQIEEKAKERASEKLDERKKKICEERSDGIKNAMSRMAEKGKKHGDWLGEVVTKIEAFVTKNSLTVDNYDSLLSSINDARATVDAAHKTLSDYKDAFDCNSDPKGISSDFKTAFQALITAEKDYKTAIKNLLQAVKAAAESADIMSNNQDTKDSNTTDGGNQ